MASDVLVVDGLADLQRALATAEKNVRLGVRNELRQVAEPIRRTAEVRSATEIRRMPWSPQWARMRTGVTRQSVYIAPRQRSRRRRGDDPFRRPNLARLMLSRAMEPALTQHAPMVEREFEQMLDRVADKFNRG